MVMVNSPFSKQRIGRRGAFMLILACVQITVGWSNLAVPPQTLATLTVFRIIPQVILGLFWIIPGLVGVGAALLDRRSIWDGPSLSLSSITIFLWGWAYVVSWFAFGELEFGSAFRTAVIYWAFSALVLVVSGWSENRPTLLRPLPEPSTRK